MKFTQIAAATLVCTLVSTGAFASGFEKTNDWGGRESGLGGAVVGSITGANSIYFNPAGMAGTKGGEVSLNFSPVWSTFSGKAQYLNTQQDGNTNLSPIFGATMSYGVTDKLGLGLGFYTAGGSRASQENMDYTGLNAGYDQIKPSTSADLKLLEFAIGPAYEVAPGFKIGLAWRVSMVKADFSFVKESDFGAATGHSKVLLNINANNLSATQYNGWKLGFQYIEPSTKSWGIGAAWRTEVAFVAKGTSSGQREFNSTAVTNLGQPTTKADLTGGAVDLGNSFPQKISLGGFFKVGDNWTLFPQWDFSNYSVDREISVTGTFAIPHSNTGNATLESAMNNASLANIAEGWKNQHIFRLGTEYTGFGSFKLRGAYSLTTQVTPEDQAKSFISSPGPAHYFDLGAGTDIMDGKMTIDGTLEYAIGSGTGSNTADNVTSGDFKSTGLTLHTGVSYRF